MTRNLESKGQIKIGPIGQKILLLLLGGIALGLTRSPRGYFKIIKAIRYDWKTIDRRSLYPAVRNLHHGKLIEIKDRQNGTTTVTLTPAGKQRALAYQIDELEIRPMQKWDHKWRIVLFDMPEKRKKARDALTRTFKRMGFYQFQKSVFITPYHCIDELTFVIEFFALRPYVKYILAESLDDESRLKKHFGLH